MAQEGGNKARNVATNRYGWIAIFLSIVFIAIIVCIIKIKYVQGDMWRTLGKRAVEKKEREARPTRGNIYADDGRLLATSEPLYGIYIDFMAEGMKKDTLMKYVTPLSEALSKKFKDKSAAQYRKIFLDGWSLSRRERAMLEKARESGSKRRLSLRSRYVRIISKDINYLELKEIRTYPFLNQRSNRSGLITEEKTMRMKPFGRIAGRTVGSIYKDFSMGGASGLELKYDSILRGIPGIKSRQHVQGRWIDVIEVEPQDGMDVKTTLSIDMQDIAEQALYNKLVETKAESGCAIVMEVETGEIKALVNLDRMTEGVYAEGNPNAFSYMSEPGSTFKTVSLMVALEDGVVKPTDSVFVGNGLFQYKGREVRDHDWRKGKDKSYVTISRGMETSSNVVISKMILKGYENDPKKYVQHIHDLGITKKIEWDVPLQGKEGTSVIRFPNDKSNPWSKTTLPWMSFGYETQVPPIYMLMFYNGIANGGKMIKPFLTKEFSQDGSVIEEFETEVLNSSLCSDHTLEQIKEILRKVVTEGTGKAVESNLFPISGKTGTAMIASGGGYSGYYVSFVGYFPSDKPKYTCFVGIRKPQGIPSGGLMPGAVFKNIAEGIYAFNMLKAPIEAPADTVHAITPKVKNGSYESTERVLDKLKQSYKSPADRSNWVTVNVDNDKIIMEGGEPIPNLVPRVLGMGAKDALYLLEKSGLRVNIQGAGKVVEQSIAPGTRLVKGSAIIIRLN